MAQAGDCESDNDRVNCSRARRPESEVVKRFQIALLTSVSSSVCFYDGFNG